MVGKGKYELGTGGRNPANNDPFATSRKGRPGRVYADCSGYIAWVCGYDRVYNLGLEDEWWLSCEGICDDASSYNDGPNYFTPIGKDQPIWPGDIIVYPPKSKLKWGHVGIIVEILPGFIRGSKDWWKYLKIAHCSPRGESAVKITDAFLWHSCYTKYKTYSRIYSYNWAL